MRKLIFLLVLLSLIACNQKQKRPLGNTRVAEIYTEFTDKNISGDSLEVEENLQWLITEIGEPINDFENIVVEIAEAHTVKKTKGNIASIPYFQNTLKKFENSSDEEVQRMIIDTYLALGFIYLYEEDNMDKALPNFLEANRLNDIYGSNFQAAQINKHLGYVYYRQSNPTFARNSFSKALDLYLKYAEPNKDNQYVIQEQISNIGLCYYGEDNLEMAVFYFDSAKAFIEHQMHDFEDEYAKQIAISIIEGNKARTLRKMGKKEEALKLLRKNYNLKVKSERYFSNAVTEYFSIVYLKKELEPQNAEKYLDTLSQLVAAEPRKDVKNKLNLLTARIIGEKNPALALKIYEDQLKYKDSTYAALNKVNLNSKIQDQRERDFQLKMSIQKKELEVEKNLSNYYLLFSIFLILFLISISLLWNRTRNKNKALKRLNAKILEQKSTIDKALKDLQNAHKNQEQLNTLKTGILGIVAHDLKSPFDAIASTVSLIKEDKSISQKEMEELLGLIELSVDSAQKVIQELIVYSMLDRKSGEIISKETWDLRDIVNKVNFLHKLKAKEKQVIIEFEENKPQPVKGDVERLERVFMNLISNAIKFSNRGGKIKIDYAKKRKSVEITVKDEGIGIPKELQTGLFTPFSNSRRNGTEGERSTGLGLSIVKMIIDAHHGSIKVNSEEGKGTEFTIILPN